MLLIIHLSYIFLIQPLLEARAKIQKYFCWFLVQMKSLEFAFEINWPLVTILMPLVLLSIKVCWAAKVSTCFQSFFYYWLNQSIAWNSFRINRPVGLKASLIFIRFTLLHLFAIIWRHSCSKKSNLIRS